MENQITGSTQQERSSSTNPLLIILGIVLVIVAGFSFYQNHQSKKRIEQLEAIINSTLQSQLEQAAKTTPAPLDMVDQINTTCQKDDKGWCFLSAGAVDWSEDKSGFIVHYPFDWNYFVDETASGEMTIGSVDAKLSKGTLTMRILQAAGGGGNCEYQTEPQTQGGNFISFRSFTDVVRTDNVKWRTSMKNEEETAIPLYYVCEYHPNGYYSTDTKIGLITITDTNGNYNPADIATLNEVLHKIEIVN